MALKVSNFYEYRGQGIKRQLRHTKEHIKRDSNRYFVKLASLNIHRQETFSEIE